MKKRALIPISALVGALLLMLVATMTSFVAERNLAYAQTNSDIATLANLRVSPGTLSPAFDPADLATGTGAEGSPHLYTVNVRHGVNSLTVSATKTDRNASVAFSGGVGTTGHINLAVGSSNVLTITVTAEDRTTQKFYRVTVTRASSTASSDATLDTLTVTPGMTDSPTTLGTKFDYSVDLTNAQATVAIVATASETADAVVTVKKGSDVIATNALSDVAIDEGDNTITVDVLAPDFMATKTYTLTINRARRNASDDATLSSLSLSQGTLMPGFDPADLPNEGTTGDPHAYTVSVPHSVFEVTVRATTTDSRGKWEVTAPADNDSTQGGHQVSLTASATTEITIMATAEDRTTERFYRVTVTRAAVGASTDATLDTLTVTPGMTDSPTTLGTKFDYSVDLTNAQATVAIVATASETADAVVTVKKGSDVIATNALSDVAIDEGDNTITVDVLAPDFVATKTYTLTINRASANASDDASLSSLSLSQGMLMPGFDPADLPNEGTNADPHAFADRIRNSVESLTVMAQAAHSGAMVSITSGQDSSVSEGAVDLIVGENVITIAVTAENRTAQKFYRVTVTRASSTASSDATLDTLTVTPGMTDSPTTLGTKFDYSVDLTNAQATVAIVATASETADAVVTVKKGSDVIATNALSDVAIDEGDNTITVDVLAPDFVATKTYTLTINRASANASDDDSLSSLSLSQGTLMPGFDPADLPNEGTTGDPHAYTARVANSVGSLTVMAEAASSGATVNISSTQDSSVSEGAVDLIVGENVITIAVTAEDRGDPKNYRVTVTRVAATASSNAALSGLSLETDADNDVDPSLNPAFEAASLPALTDGAHHFTASVSRGTDVINVAPDAADDDAVITVMSDADDTVMALTGGDAGKYAVDLEVGDNVITVMVLAENVVATKTYKITINRPGVSNAALSDLSLSGLSLNEAFGTAADDAYTADATESIDSTTVMAEAVQGNATVSIMPDDADSAMDGHQVALTTGSNTITVTVTAGSNTRAYTVTVTVAPPVEGDLLDRYDADDSGDIDLTEVSAAIDDYFNGDLTLAQVSDVIDLYFQ